MSNVANFKDPEYLDNISKWNNIIMVLELNNVDMDNIYHEINELPVDILDMHNKDSKSILDIACENNFHDIVNILCEKGCNIMKDSFINYIIRNNLHNKIIFIHDQVNNVPENITTKLTEKIWFYACKSEYQKQLLEEMIKYNLQIPITKYHIGKAVTHRNYWFVNTLVNNITDELQNHLSSPYIISEIIENHDINMIRILVSKGFNIQGLISLHDVKKHHAHNIENYINNEYGFTKYDHVSHYVQDNPATTRILITILIGLILFFVEYAMYYLYSIGGKVTVDGEIIDTFIPGITLLYSFMCVVISPMIILGFIPDF